MLLHLIQAREGDRGGEKEGGKAEGVGEKKWGKKRVKIEKGRVRIITKM